MKFNYWMLGAIHIFLVITIMIIFNYQQVSDSPRYIAVADEFASFNFTAQMNCHTAPGYPLFLAIIKLLTWHNKFLIALVQSILFILSLKYFLNGIQFKYEIPNFGISLLSVFVLLNPEILHLNGTSLTESLAASLILFICGSLVNNLKYKIDKYIFVFCTAYLVITKMEYILILPVLLFFLFLTKERKMILLTLSVIFGLMTLNGLKNYNIYNVFNMTSFGSGTVIYGGNNLNLNGSWHIQRNTKNYIPKSYESTFDSLSKLDPSCACIKIDSLYKRMAIDAWKDNYFNQLKVIPIKFGKQWLLPGSIDFYTGQTEIHTGLQLDKLFSDKFWPWYAKYKHGAYLFIYWISLMFSLIGIRVKLSKYKFDNIDFLIISILLINTLMYSIPFYGLGRFHWPVISILFYYSVYFFNSFEKKNAG